MHPFFFMFLIQVLVLPTFCRQRVKHGCKATEVSVKLDTQIYAERRKIGHAKRKCSINGLLFQVKGDKKARSRGICTSSGTGCCR